MFTLYIIFCVKVRVFIRLRSWEFIESMQVVYGVQ